MFHSKLQPIGRMSRRCMQICATRSRCSRQCFQIAYIHGASETFTSQKSRVETRSNRNWIASCARPGRRCRTLNRHQLGPLFGEGAGRPQPLPRRSAPLPQTAAHHNRSGKHPSHALPDPATSAHRVPAYIAPDSPFSIPRRYRPLPTKSRHL